LIELNKLYNQNVYEFIHKIPNNYINLIISDPPAGAGLTKEKWDKKINPEKYGWEISKFNEICFFKLKDSGSLYLCQWLGEKNPLHLGYVMYYTNNITNFRFKEMITWRKTRGNGNRKGWLQITEHLLWYVKNNKKFFWNEEFQYDYSKKRAYNIKKSKNKSDYKRYTNVWDIKELGFGTCPKNFKKEREKYGKHSTPKPPELFECIIKAHTNPGDIVFIPFSGTGVGEKVCKHLGRNFISCEWDG
jgi:DNA modification methylase